MCLFKAAAGQMNKQHLWLFIHLLVLIAFASHVCILLFSHLHPLYKETHIEERMLDKMKFPVVFKICFKPGFDLQKLQEVGYDSVSGYFSGQSRFNNSVFGWAGHTAGGGVFGSFKGKVG